MMMDTPPPPEDFGKKPKQEFVIPVNQKVKMRFWDAIYGIGVVLTIEEIVNGIEGKNGEVEIVGLNEAEEVFSTDPSRIVETRRLVTPLEYARDIGREDLVRAIEKYASSDKSSEEFLRQLGREAITRNQCCQPYLRKAESFNLLDWLGNVNYFYGRTSSGSWLDYVFSWLEK